MFDSLHSGAAYETYQVWGVVKYEEVMSRKGWGILPEPINILFEPR